MRCDLQGLERKGAMFLDYRNEGTIIELKADQVEACMGSAFDEEY